MEIGTTSGLSWITWDVYSPKEIQNSLASQQSPAGSTLCLPPFRASGKYLCSQPVGQEA